MAGRPAGGVIRTDAVRQPGDRLAEAAESADHGHVPVAGLCDQTSFGRAMLRARLIEVVRSAIARAWAQASTLAST